MDNTSDNVLGLDTVAAGVAAAGNIAKGIRDKAKAKKAQKISDAGGYLTLTAYQKSLIPVPPYVGTQLQNISQATGTPVDTTQVQALPPIPATAGQLGQTVKNYLPYILGAVALGFVIYFIARK